jgi:chemotaxis protein methyltransferase CheR
VIPEIRDRVHFRQHDLLSLNAGGKNFDLIVCKNVLLHFAEEDRVRVLAMFHEALRPGGLLAMEHTQKMPERLKPHFRCLNSYAQVYQKAEQVTEMHPAHRQMPLETGLRPFGLGSEKTVKDSATI